VTPDLSEAVARVPRLILGLGLAGACVAWYLGGVAYSTAFLLGAFAAYFNFLLIERFVNRLVRKVLAAGLKHPMKHPGARGFGLFIQLALFVTVAFVILRFTGLNLVVAFCGFLACPAAVMLESVYYLISIYGHS
jgi:hypothetical protein